MNAPKSTKREERNKLIETLFQIDFESLESRVHPRVRPENVILLAHVHCLPSVSYLFDFLVKYHGLRPSQIAILPKRYSTIASAVCSLKELGIKIIENSEAIKPGQYDQSAAAALCALCKFGEERIESVRKFRAKPRVILLDDGGLLTEHWSRRKRSNTAHKEMEVVSVQQTASGVYREPMHASMPKINVAFSAAKRRFESKIIAGGVLRKIDSLNMHTKNKLVGVVGYGSIGTAVAAQLQTRAGDLLIYDKVDVETQFELARSQSDLFRKADFIFGCTGRNWVQLAAFEKATKPIRYISCSSRDVEFQTLVQNRFLKYLNNDEFGRIELTGPPGQVVENAGFPVNFDRQAEWETPSEIGLTRALVLAGILQAMCLKVPAREWNIQLSAAAQQHLVQNWLSLCDNQADVFGVSSESISSLNWWNHHSLGVSM